MSFGRHLLDRELDRDTAIKPFYSSEKFVKDLELTHQLFGHSGCINSLCWSPDGRLLASGSDDTHINLYSTDSPAYPLQIRFPTGHDNNIFSVKFMPKSNNSVVVSAAGDNEVRVFDLQNGEAKRRDVFRCYKDRVKRIVPDGDSPYMFLTCSEDGDIRHIDLRSPKRYYTSDSAPPPLISYSQYRISLNALTLAASQPQYIVVGGAHHALFLHDRRFLPRDIGGSWGMPTDPNKSTQCVRRFAPKGKTAHHVTSAKFSNANPNELLGSWSADGIYLFDIHSNVVSADKPGQQLKSDKPRFGPVFQSEVSASNVDDTRTAANSVLRNHDRVSEEPGQVPSTPPRRLQGHRYLNMRLLIDHVRVLQIDLHEHIDFAASEVVANDILEIFQTHDLPLTPSQFEIYKYLVAVTMYFRRVDCVAKGRGELREQQRLQSRRSIDAVSPDDEAYASDSEDESVAPVVKAGWSPRYDVIRCLLQHAFTVKSRRRTIRVPNPEIFNRQAYDNHHTLWDCEDDEEIIAMSEYDLVQKLRVDIETRQLPSDFWRRAILCLLKVEAVKIDREMLHLAFGSHWTRYIDVSTRFRDQLYDPEAEAQGPEYDSDNDYSIEYYDMAFDFSTGDETYPDDQDLESEASVDENVRPLPVFDAAAVDAQSYLPANAEYAYPEDGDSADEFLEDESEDAELNDELDGDADDVPWFQYTRGDRLDPSTAQSEVPMVPPLRAFRGHCNVQTIKDVNFFGANDEYVMSGSDSGHLFIWEKQSARIVQILEADTEIVNVMQPHPQLPQIAVSGIDRTIKIFSPYSLDYNPRSLANRAKLPTQRTGFWVWNSVSDTFDTYEEVYPTPNDIGLAALREGESANPFHTKSLLAELHAPRKFLGPSRSHIAAEYSIVTANQHASRQGLADTSITRSILADFAGLHHGDGETFNENDEAGCIVS